MLLLYDSLTRESAFEDFFEEILLQSVLVLLKYLAVDQNIRQTDKNKPANNE